MYDSQPETVELVRVAIRRKRSRNAPRNDSPELGGFHHAEHTAKSGRQAAHKARRRPLPPRPLEHPANVRATRGASCAPQRPLVL
jgi:hypothetical protein